MKIKSDTQKMIIEERNTDSQVGSVLSISVGILFLFYFFFAKSIPIAGLDKNPGLLIMLLGLFLIGVGISFLSKTEKIQTSLDKSGPCVHKKSRLFSPVSDARQFELKDITAVDHHVTSRTRMQNNGRPTYRITSEVSLVLKNGNTLEIGHKTKAPPAVYAGVGNNINAKISTKAPLEKLSKEVAEFVGVKVKQNQIPSEDPRKVIDSLLNTADKD